MLLTEEKTTYDFAIQAFNQHGYSRPVSVRNSTRVFSPTGARDVRATPLSSTEIQIEWRKPVRGRVTKYHIKIWRAGKKDRQNAWLISKGDGRFVAGSLKKNKSYRWSVKFPVYFCLQF